MDSGKETLIPVRVTPGAKRNAVTALKAGVWHIKIAAPPLEGRANAALLAYLSKTLGVRERGLCLLKGHKNRSKLVSVAGLSPEEITLRLSAELDG